MMVRRMIDVMPDPADGGIFDEIKTWAPWRLIVTDADVLDLEYIYNHSGQKGIAPMLDYMVRVNEGNGEDPKISDANLTTMGKIIKAHYSESWSRLFATLSVQYDPLENYNRVESGSDTTTHTGTVTDDGSDDLTHGEVVTAGGSDTTERKISGYDDLTYKPSEQEIYSPTTTATHSGTDERTMGNERTYDTEDETTYGKTISGNIGVTTSQQMLQAERDVWLWDFFQIVYKDLDKLFTIPVYF